MTRFHPLALLGLAFCAAGVGRADADMRGLVATGPTAAPSGLPRGLHRLDPVLRSLQIAPSARPPKDVVLSVDSSGQPRVPALLDLEPGAVANDLKAWGVRIDSDGSRSAGQGRPQIVSAEIPLAALDRVAAWPGLRYAEVERRGRLLLDRSIPAVRADVARKTYHRAGRGVAIGIVDSGIDLHHPDFLTPDGRTRVRYLWDQTDSNGPAPADFGYGREYTGDQINAALANGLDLPEKDGDPIDGGHGTHVTGIAAGGGGGTTYPGVAPEADLIIVKWDHARGLDANRYLVARAASLGEPVVVNNSWGGQGGPHDGSDAEAVGLGELSGPGMPGRVLCFAAGNAGNQTIHLSGALGPGGTGEVTLNAPVGLDEWEVELWADARAGYRFGIRYPTDLAGMQRATAWIASGDPMQQKIDLPASTAGAYGGAHLLLDAADRPYPPNPKLQRCMIHVDLRDTAGGALKGLDWSLVVQRVGTAGTDALDGWITLGSGLQFGNSAGGLSGDTRKTLVNQACLLQGVTVAAYVSKTDWTAWNDVPVAESPMDGMPGDPSPFSSQGPTRDGRSKPDCTAPGQWIASSLSNDIGVNAADPQFITADGQRLLLEGTSMAAPHVAGSIAMMLQADPTLDADQVRALLVSGMGTSGAWSPKEGAGKLDAFQSLRLTVDRRLRMPGDLDGDGRVTLEDATMALQRVVGLIDVTPEELKIADVAPARTADRPAGDGRLTLADVTRIVRRSVGLEANPWP